ncbi:MAG: long-chain-fatty-acid--CoA ligase-like protein [Ramlibacter sp.]|uniref:AMP-dependent synthetase/ligase n=1 Tax=Ramlibacter sp. TaxID=1917967 RepID=UPI00262D19B5|nr:AMP-binding protein [Ramlibacter sp.]MDB5749693.1 long-chain-fatty-acid--CoA ligase-like protein [Ramlibacter sp.]
METTFPRLLLLHAAQRPAAPAMREKEYGIWQALSWARLAQLVEQIACGLHQAGLRRGEHMVLVGANRPRLYATMLAAQSLRAIPVPLYQDAVAAECMFPIHNAQVRFAFAEDQKQVDKLLEVRAQCPHLAAIYYDAPRGLRNYDEPGLASLDTLIAAGRTFAEANAGFFEARIGQAGPDDVAAMFFTSGTTGQAKGVVHTHRTLLDRASAGAEFDRLTEAEEVLACMPPAWVGQNIFSYAQWLACGFVVNCPESAATVMIDLKEIGPTYYFAPPRIFEALLTGVMTRMEDASASKRGMFHAFMELARRVGPTLRDGKPVSALDRLKYALGDLMVYGPLRNNLGLSRVRVAYTAGEAIGPDLFTFYRAIGVNLKQLYGSTETAVLVCMQPDNQVHADTVGIPCRDVEIRLTDSGEILVRSPGLLREYYRNPQATAEVKDAQGWYHTGDAGFLDARGHLKIIDRAKDLGRLADGALFAPKYIENKLKFFPHIKEAVAVGDRRESVCVMLNIDFDAVGNWAGKRNLCYAGYTDLTQKPEVYQLLRECIEKVNADLAADEKLAGSQVHRFLVLHKELDADDGELTRTDKVRRDFIAQRYQQLVEALYGGKTEQFIATQVRFEDGRTGSVSATLKIMDARTFAPLQAAA